MRRFVLWTALVGLGLAIAGCGGGSGGTGGPATSLEGTWEHMRRSTDGGQNWTTVTNRFQFSYNQDGTWTDSNGDSGRWRTNGGLLTVTHDTGTKPTEYFVWQLQNNANVLRIWEADFQGTRSQRVSDYSRIY